MCDYCGCQQRTTIDELTAEHAAIGAVADRLAAAHAAGDRTGGLALCAEVLPDDAWSRLEAERGAVAGAGDGRG